MRGGGEEDIVRGRVAGGVGGGEGVEVGRPNHWDMTERTMVRELDGGMQVVARLRECDLARG